MRSSVCLCAVVMALAPRSVAAQSTPVRLCGHAMSVGADRAVTGLGSGPLAFEAGEVRIEEAGPRAAVIYREREGVEVEAALVGCRGTDAPTLVWRGSTAWHGEDATDRTRDVVVVRDVDRDGALDVAVLTLRADAPFCGLDAGPVRALRLAPESLAMVPDGRFGPTVLLPHQARRAVEATTARAQSTALHVRGVRATAGDARALFDGDDRSAWTAPGGAWITFTTPASVPVRGVDFTAAEGRAGAMTVLLWPSGQRLDVTWNARAPGVGEVWRVTLPAEVPTTCVSVLAAPSGVALRSLAMRSVLDDGASARASLVQRLGGPDGGDALALLLSLGDAGIGAAVEALPSLDDASARRVVRALGGMRGPVAMAALVEALLRPSLESAALDALRDVGPTALPLLAARTATAPAAVRAVAAMRAPAGDRVAALAPVFGADDEVWRASRDAVRAVALAAARENAGGAWVQAIPEVALGAARALRMGAEVFANDPLVRRALADRALALWNAHRDFELRWRIAPALAASPEGVDALRDALAHDADHDLRAECARALTGVADASEALRAALGDRAPRVRIAALRALSDNASSVEARLAVLTNDGWPAVRAEAARGLAREARATAALRASLDAASTVTVTAAIEALAESPDPTATAALTGFLDQGRRASVLRRAAAEALGRRCDPTSAEVLERVATGLTDPALPPWEQAVGHTALASLAQVDAARARAFLTRSEANAEALSAVERAARRGCAVASPRAR